MEKILIDIIFRGQFSKMDISLLPLLMMGAKKIYFSEPNAAVSYIPDDVLSTINSSSYVDLAICTECLDIDGEIVPHVFINFGRSEEEVELLFFLDLNDLAKTTTKSRIDYLKEWAIKTQKNYNFEYVICQIDNGNEEEYYFDSNGTGKFYPS